jgi:hypothetical protein
MLHPRIDDDEEIVSTALRELAGEPAIDRPLPDPSFIWWKAQLLRRFEAEREVTAPLEMGDRMHIGAALLGAIALLAGAWDQLPSLAFTSSDLVVVALAAIVLLSVVAVVTVEAIRER